MEGCEAFEGGAKIASFFYVACFEAVKMKGKEMKRTGDMRHGTTKWPGASGRTFDNYIPMIL